MKKDSRHNLIKMIAFAMVFVVILGVLGVAFTPKRSDPGSGITNSNARGFYGEPKNSIDVLILGDSNAYSACSPMYIWNRFGIPTYVAAEGFQNVTGVLYPIRCKTLLDGGRRRTKNLYGVFKRTVPAGQVRQ